MSAGAVIAAKQNRYMRRFEQAGATSFDGARTLDELGCRSSLVFHGLVRRGIFVEVSSGRYYLDVDRAEAFRDRRRAIVLVALAAVLVVVLVVLWTR